MPKLNPKKKLLEYLARSIVLKPDAVKVTLTQSEGDILLNLEVDPSDLGIIIGKKGKTIQAIRNLVRLQAPKVGERVEIQLIDEKVKEEKK